MNRRTIRLLPGMMIVSLMLLGAVYARADVTVKRHATLKGLGGIMNSEITSTESLKGDMQATESDTRMTNKVMKFLGAGKPIKTTSIIRLDKGVMWDVNHQEKSYTEMTFEQMHKMMDSLGTIFAGGKGMEQKPQLDTSEVTFSPPTFDVQKTGKTETIAGYGCDGSVLTMTTEGTNKKTGEKMKIIVAMDMMMAKNVPGADEEAAFGKKMAQAMGFEMDSRSAQPMASMMGAYGIDPKKLAAEAEKLQGFPMRTVMEFKLEGKQFEQQQSQASGQEGSAQQGQGSEKAEEGKSEEGSKSPSEAAAKALGGLFGKKKDKGKEGSSAQPKSEGAPQQPPDNSLFSLTSEVTEISTSAVTGDRFEVPAGYKKEKGKTEK